MVRVLVAVLLAASADALESTSPLADEHMSLLQTMAHTQPHVATSGPECKAAKKQIRADRAAMKDIRQQIQELRDQLKGYRIKLDDSKGAARKVCPNMGEAKDKKPKKSKGTVTHNFQCGRGDHIAPQVTTEGPFPLDEARVQEQLEICSQKCSENPLCNYMQMLKYNGECQFRTATGKLEGPGGIDDAIRWNPIYDCFQNPGYPWVEGKIVEHYYCAGGDGEVKTRVSMDPSLIEGKSKDEQVKICVDACKETPTCDLVTHYDHGECKFWKRGAMTPSRPDGGDNIQLAVGHTCWGRKK